MRSVVIPRGAHSFVGGPTVDAVAQISRAGSPVTLTMGSHSTYSVEFRGLRLHDEQSDILAALYSWFSSASRGLPFQFALDTDKRTATTLTAPATSAVLAVADETGFVANDVVYLEDATDRAKFEYAVVASTGTNVVTLDFEGTWDYVTGSVLRHFEYFPNCVLVNPSPPAIHRNADRGGYLWDVLFGFRTVT